LPEDGFRLVSNESGEWYRAIHELLDDPDLRQRLAQRSYEWVQDNWTLARLGHKWYDFCKIAAERPRIERLEDTRPGSPAKAL
jgi:glycosyltransferase involved in cell wall biosynthesis